MPFFKTFCISLFLPLFLNGGFSSEGLFTLNKQNVETCDGLQSKFLSWQRIQTKGENESDFLFKRTFTYKWILNIKYSKQVLAELRTNCPSAIYFNENLLTPYDNGGTCTAMALDFLGRYFVKCSHLQDSDVRLDVLKGFASHYGENTTTFVSRQAAFNTIGIHEEALNLDSDFLKEQKIQSLANFYGIQLTPLTPTMSLPSIHFNSSSFISLVNNLPGDTYVLRAIYPKENVKMEWFGHTMLLIKEEAFSIFYDNFVGSRKVSSEGIGEVISAALIKWSLPEIRIYHASIQNEIKNLASD
ncbi:MAG: hypothetical protein H0T62_07355 [Parachlamydiaceae bacterium]|nr:hypothetical protein [Parachlamydiaceae bacterium]